MENNLGNKKTMADNIKRLMFENNVSAVDVCRALDVPESTFSYWLNAKSYPRIDKIEKMARFFGVTKSDLVEEYNDKVNFNLQIFSDKKTAEGEFGSLSEGEIELIKVFRMIPVEQQAIVLNMIRAAVTTRK